MIEYINGDVLNSGEAIVVHGCNCFNTMGGGIARQVAEEYREAYMADYSTIAGDASKMGTYTTAIGQNGTRIINAYTQYGYSRNKVSADYHAIEEVMARICTDFPDAPVIAMPKIGAGLAGGDWDIIEEILTRVSNEYDKTFRVYLFNNVFPVAPVKPDFQKWKEMLDAAKEETDN